MINDRTLITGSTSGIGKQIGIDLLKKGHLVVFTGRTISSRDKLISELKSGSLPNNWIVISPIDFSKKESIEFLKKSFVRDNLEMDNIILNVGATCREPFETISMKEWDMVMDTNLKIPFFLIQKLLPIIKKRIIFIGSVLGHIPNSASIPYGVSKGSLEILTQYLAKELASKNITVNTIAPGFTDSNWHNGKLFTHLDEIKKQILLNRFATTNEISHACQFIIENDYINGHTLCVDGGYGL